MASRKFDWKKLRSSFPALRKYVYANTAAGAPLPKAAYEASTSYLDDLSASGDHEWERWLSEKEKIRAKLAKSINAGPRELGFTSGTSHSMNLVAQMIWDSGGRKIVTLGTEFPATTLPFLHRRFETRFVEPRAGVYRAEDLAEAVDGHTSALVVSHVQYGSGYTLDLEQAAALCSARRCKLVVNACQSLGARPLDVRQHRIDFLVGTSHKWLCGGHGAGLIYIKDALLAELRLPVVGWTSVGRPELMENRRLDIRREASALEVGCHSYDAILRLGASLDLLLQAGYERIHERICELTTALRSGLRALQLFPTTPDDLLHRSGITAFTVPDPVAFVAFLEKRKILASVRQGAVRLSLHAYNDEKDVKAILAGCEAAAKKQPKVAPAAR